MGYEIRKHELACKEQIGFTPIDIVYDLIYDDSVPVLCYFTEQIYLAYRNYIGRNVKGKERQDIYLSDNAHIVKNYFTKTDENMKKHI